MARDGEGASPEQGGPTTLAAFETRLAHDLTAEMAEALRNIGLIARFRLEDLLSE